MLYAVEPATILGGVGSFLAALIGALAFYQGRRTEHKTATREEVKQAFDLQDLAVKEVRETNVRLTEEVARVRSKNDEMHDTLNNTFAKMAELKAEHNRCQHDLNNLGYELRNTVERMRVAEARIAELGG